MLSVTYGHERDRLRDTRKEDKGRRSMILSRTREGHVWGRNGNDHAIVSDDARVSPTRDRRIRNMIIGMNRDWHFEA